MNTAGDVSQCMQERICVHPGWGAASSPLSAYTTVACETSECKQAWSSW